MSKGLKITLVVVAGFLASLILVVIGFVSKWFDTAVDVVSPDNVKAQHEQVIGKYNGMIAAADNTCTVQESGTAGNDRSATLVEDPTLAYQATFRKIVSEYNSSVDNLFKAGIVAPPGDPESVDINSLDTSDWCTVSDQLIDSRN